MYTNLTDVPGAVQLQSFSKSVFASYFSSHCIILFSVLLHGESMSFFEMVPVPPWMAVCILRFPLIEHHT